MEADYVIVGAGSAGSVVAARLSEDPGAVVVVLEAGGADTNKWIHIPLGYGKTFADPSINWCYETEPDPGLGGRRIFWPRGKVLGGSSSINGLLYVRGQAADYDHWRQLGNAGWSYADVLPYFRRSEDRIGRADKLHGTGGGLAVSDVVGRHPLSEAFIQAAMDEGIARNDDFNGAEQEGVGYYQTTSRRGRRCSAAVGFLRPAMKRPNLQVVTGAMVTRLVFMGRHAAGVRFQREGGEEETIRARREVILCGGAVNTPQLLMLSGVGPAAHLRSFGIEIVQDAPGVGQNLQDHLKVGFAYRCREKITVNDVMQSRLRMLRAGLEYGLFRRGPLALSAASAGIFTRTRKELATPDIQFHFINFSSDVSAAELHPFSGFTQHVCQLRPESRGVIELRSDDPAMAPAIHPNYLAEEIDRRTIVAGLKLARRIAAQPALRRYIESEHAPGEAVQTDDEFLDYARRTGSTVFHPVGTARMGSDAMAVVDDKLRVHGVDGLRVADASIMPTLVSGNTNAACIMIGEKCAAMASGKELARAT